MVMVESVQTFPHAVLTLSSQALASSTYCTVGTGRLPSPCGI